MLGPGKAPAGTAYSTRVAMGPSRAQCLLGVKPNPLPVLNESESTHAASCACDQGQGVRKPRLMRSGSGEATARSTYANSRPRSCAVELSFAAASQLRDLDTSGLCKSIRRPALVDLYHDRSPACAAGIRNDMGPTTGFLSNAPVLIQ